MGGQVSSDNIVYSIPVTPKKQGESSVYRNPKSEKGLVTFPDTQTRNLRDVIKRSADRVKDKNFLGTRKGDKYEYLTYGQAYETAKHLSSGIQHLNLAPEVSEYKHYKLKNIGVFAKNRTEWMVLDIANTLHNRTMVPLYDSLGIETISYVIGHSSITTCFSSKEGIDMILKSKDLFKLKYLVALDAVTPEQTTLATQRNLEIKSWSEVIEVGKQKPYPDEPELQLDDVFTFSYTSGTTGDPKGAMISQRNMVAVITAIQGGDGAAVESDVGISYLPLPHIMERIGVWATIYVGAEICFYGGDVLKLKDDLALAKPTSFVSVPRIYNRLYAAMKKGVDDLDGCKKSLATHAIETKIANLRESAQYTHGVWDGIIFKKMQEAMGGRVRKMATGSAPISNEVLEFMKISQACQFLEGYGQTENTGATFMTRRDDPKGGHVGGPSLPIEFKVVDIPEMNYLSTDEKPRGEVCTRGPMIFLGYYKDEKKTQEAFDADGFLKTGDVGEIQPNGSLKIIDRAKNIFKLAQGEYVAPEKVEQIYARVPGVDSNFVHGESLQAFCVAVVSPNKDVLQKLATEQKISGTHEELCQNLQLRKHFLKVLNAAGKQAGLFGFEQAKNIHLEPKTLLELKLLTVTLKTQRHQAKVHFKGVIDQLYKEGELDIK